MVNNKGSLQSLKSTWISKDTQKLGDSKGPLKNKVVSWTKLENKIPQSPDHDERKRNVRSNERKSPRNNSDFDGKERNGSPLGLVMARRNLDIANSDLHLDLNPWGDKIAEKDSNCAERRDEADEKVGDNDGLQYKEGKSSVDGSKILNVKLGPLDKTDVKSRNKHRDKSDLQDNKELNNDLGVTMKDNTNVRSKITSQNSICSSEGDLENKVRKLKSGGIRNHDRKTYNSEQTKTEEKDGFTVESKASDTTGYQQEELQFNLEGMGSCSDKTSIEGNDDGLEHKTKSQKGKKLGLSAMATKTILVQYCPLKPETSSNFDSGQSQDSPTRLCKRDKKYTAQRQRSPVLIAHTSAHDTSRYLTSYGRDRKTTKFHPSVNIENVKGKTKEAKSSYNNKAGMCNPPTHFFGGADLELGPNGESFLPDAGERNRKSCIRQRNKSAIRYHDLKDVEPYDTTKVETIEARDEYDKANTLRASGMAISSVPYQAPHFMTKKQQIFKLSGLPLDSVENSEDSTRSSTACDISSSVFSNSQESSCNDVSRKAEEEENVRKKIKSPDEIGQSHSLKDVACSVDFTSSEEADTEDKVEDYTESSIDVSDEKMSNWNAKSPSKSSSDVVNVVVIGGSNVKEKLLDILREKHDSPRDDASARRWAQRYSGVQAMRDPHGNSSKESVRESKSFPVLTASLQVQSGSRASASCVSAAHSQATTRDTMRLLDTRSRNISKNSSFINDDDEEDDTTSSDGSTRQGVMVNRRIVTTEVCRIRRYTFSKNVNSLFHLPIDPALVRPNYSRPSNYQVSGFTSSNNISKTSIATDDLLSLASVSTSYASCLETLSSDFDKENCGDVKINKGRQCNRPKLAALYKRSRPECHYPKTKSSQHNDLRKREKHLSKACKTNQSGALKCSEGQVRRFGEIKTSNMDNQSFVRWLKRAPLSSSGVPRTQDQCKPRERRISKVSSENKTECKPASGLNNKFPAQPNVYREWSPCKMATENNTKKDNNNIFSGQGKFVRNNSPPQCFSGKKNDSSTGIRKEGKSKEKRNMSQSLPKSDKLVTKSTVYRSLSASKVQCEDHKKKGNKTIFSGKGRFLRENSPPRSFSGKRTGSCTKVRKEKDGYCHEKKILCSSPPKSCSTSKLNHYRPTAKSVKKLKQKWKNARLYDPAIVPPPSPNKRRGVSEKNRCLHKVLSNRQLIKKAFNTRLAGKNTDAPIISPMKPFTQRRNLAKRLSSSIREMNKLKTKRKKPNSSWHNLTSQRNRSNSRQKDDSESDEDPSPILLAMNRNSQSRALAKATVVETKEADYCFASTSRSNDQS